MQTSLAHPSEGGASFGELGSLTWERIQLIIRLLPTGGGRLDPDALVLRSVHTPGAWCRPVRSWTFRGELVVRFNVMLGPAGMPLDAGRWLLGLSDGSRLVHLKVRLRQPETALAGRAFRLARGELRFIPTLGGDGSLALEVTFDRSRGTRAANRSLVARLLQVLLRPARRLRRATWRRLFAVLRLLARRNGRRILFISDYGLELTDNLKLVYARMVQRGLHREYELRKLTKSGLNARRSFRDQLSLPWLLARADTVVIARNHRLLQRIGAGQHRIIQLWHASGAIKTFGYSRIGMPRGPSPWSRDHKHYTFAIVSGEHDVPLYAEAFGIPEERVIPTGIPRVDRFFDPKAREEGRAAALEAFPEARGRMVILFAPTFRDRQRQATYDLGRLDFARLHALCVEKDAVFLIRLHPFVRERPVIPPAYGDRILDASSPVMGAPDLLFATDLLVTDYSSIVFEYATLGRPMLFFAYDLEEYLADRNTYVPYGEFVPGRIVRTFGELVEAIRRDDYEAEKVAPFAERHFSHRDGRATDRVVDLILGR